MSGKAHLLGDVAEGPVDRLAEDLVGMRVDRDDPPAMSLHVRRHRVRRLERSGTRADHGDGVIAGQDALDGGVSTGHPVTVTRRAAAAAPRVSAETRG